MTIRLSTIVWMILWVVAAFGLYMVKYKVQTLKTDVVAIERQILQEKKNLRVLNAEWAFLNRPERLQELADKHLKSHSMHSQQVADFYSLPTGSAPVIQPVATQEEEGVPHERPVLVRGVAAHGQ